MKCCARIALVVAILLGICDQSDAQLASPKVTLGAQSAVHESEDAVSRISLSAAERDELAALAKEIPAVDLDIPFDTDSAAVSEEAKPTIDTLGRALSDPDLRGGTFLIAGHTDGFESENYCQDLSERRADAIKRVLIKVHGIPSESLIAVGYGSSKLKNIRDPFALSNNRVRIFNMETKKLR
jgi:outer membrane protein OmpA-like peptidoglycan-associated protein